MIADFRLRKQCASYEWISRVSSGPRGGLAPGGGRRGGGAVPHGGAHVGHGHAAARVPALCRRLAPAAAAAALRQPLQPTLAQLLRYE